MRKIGALGIALVLLISGIGLLGASIVGDKPEEKDMHGNTTKFITGTGFNPWEYNYVAHLFSGYYCNAYLKGSNLPPYTGSIDEYPSEHLAAFQDHWTYPYRDVKLIMKWNDAWLSNQDQDGDLQLDRHFGYTSYRGSGAWLTNHQSGTYEEDGQTIKWNYFVKIVAAPTDAYSENGYWYAADDTEIGPIIWGSFARIQQIENDPGIGVHGAQYISPNSCGFGAYGPE
jgi:hypothetical protein